MTESIEKCVFKNFSGFKATNSAKFLYRTRQRSKQLKSSRPGFSIICKSAKGLQTWEKVGHFFRLLMPIPFNFPKQEAYRPHRSRESGGVYTLPIIKTFRFSPATRADFLFILPPILSASRGTCDHLMRIETTDTSFHTVLILDGYY